MAQANVPAPPREHGAWLLAGALALLGAGGAGGRPAARRGRARPRSVAAPPEVPVGGHHADAERRGVGQRTGARLARSPPRAPRERRAAAAIVARPSGEQQQLDAARLVDQTQTHIAARWMEGFYAIYATAQRTFGVNWLLIASIHRQESAFSTAPDTYTG